MAKQKAGPSKAAKMAPAKAGKTAKMPMKPAAPAKGGDMMAQGYSGMGSAKSAPAKKRGS